MHGNKAKIMHGSMGHMMHGNKVKIMHGSMGHDAWKQGKNNAWKHGS